LYKEEEGILVRKSMFGALKQWKMSNKFIKQAKTQCKKKEKENNFLEKEKVVQR
jgi:hypothetical protein